MKNILLAFLFVGLFSTQAQAIEQEYHGIIYTALGDTSGRVRAANISQMPDGKYLVHFYADLADIEIVMATYADASALAINVRDGAEIRCDTAVKTPNAIVCTVFNVTI